MNGPYSEDILNMIDENVGSLIYGPQSEDIPNMLDENVGSLIYGPYSVYKQTTTDHTMQAFQIVYQ